MKRIQLMIVGLFCLMSSYSQLTEAEDKGLDKLIGEQVKLEIDELSSVDINKVFDAQFYKVKRIALYKSNKSYNESVFLKINGILSELFDPNTLLTSMRSSFFIRNKNDANCFKSALSHLLEDGDVESDEIVNKDARWLLVCNEWFGDKRGYIVSVDDKGKVKGIEYSDKLEID